MSDIKLFRLNQGVAKEITSTTSDLEKPLQTLVEDNLVPLLGIRFLATEYWTGKVHSGRIDTLGLDENNCPVIIEYKRSLNENVINQGLFYLDWLMDHLAEFKLLVLEKLGKDLADAIDWTSPRLICIAGEFTRYDAHAVQQINRNIELLRYRRFGADLLLLELVNAVTADPLEPATPDEKKIARPGGTDKAVTEWLADLPPTLAPVFEALEKHLLSLGDDVQRKDLKLYIAFKRLRNFATVIFQKKRLILHLHLDPILVKMEDGFTRDVSNIGHWGTGDTEITLGSLTDLEKAKSYIAQAYEGGSRES